ncbi:MAG: SCO family protein [Sulfuritalea sp.]|nr:SCO family protein [Sulfuritalea sp.]
MRDFARLVCLLLAVLLCAGTAAAASDFNGVDISHTRSYAQDFALTDQDGRPRTLADFRGKAVVLFFGYLQCPNFCPLTLARLAETMQLLGGDAKRVQVLFVTLDPERDVPAALKEYVSTFHPSFLGLYTSAAATPELALKFRIYFRKVPAADGSNYSIDHAVFSYAYDANGKLRLLLRDTLSSAQLAADLRRLLQHP